MFRSLNNRWCLLLLSALTAMLWLLPVRSGHAAVYTYNARQRIIHAGVLFVGSAADTAPDPAPYVFYVLNSRADVKPVGWTFTNPIAPATVTTAISTRWGTNYASGASITPEMAAYWEVPLRDVSADDLQQFDVLYLHASATGYSPAFLPSDNEKLRRFVDSGGQLIVEYGGTAGVPALFTDTLWNNASNPNVTLVSDPTPNALLTQHPIVSQPNPLWSADPHFPFLLGQSNDLNTNTIFGTISAGPTNEFANLFGAALYRTATTGLTSATPTLPGVSAAQLGAGQVVVSALDVGPSTSVTSTAFFTTPTSPHSVFQAASGDLKFLSNVVSWADTHPTENKTSHQNASGPSAASFTAAWSYPDPAAGATLSSRTAPAGAAVWGNFVFVTDSTGLLHAFDAYPDQDLTGKGSPDLGTAPAKPYGEIWPAVSVGANASAPTVGNYGGQTYVFVERANGSVVQHNSVTGALVATLTPPNGSTVTYPQGTTTNAPAPTYYEGRIYAAQADGTLFVYDLNSTASAGGGAILPVNPANANGAGSGEYATASPAVGLLPSGAATNTIIALVPTTQNMNTVLLGSRNDPLVGYSTNGQFQGYNVNRNARYNLPNLFVDPASVPAPKAYDSSGNILGTISGTGQDPVFQSSNQPVNQEDRYGDWDVDFLKSIPQGAGMTLTLHEIKALSLANTATGGAVLSAPAIDRQGDYYYTVDDGTDSYLFGVHDDIQQRNVRLKFRFRLPRSGDMTTINPDGTINWSTPANAVDADNVKYGGDGTVNNNKVSNSLFDFRFVGAPVVDGQGNVYVAAQFRTSGTATTGTAAVLCFNADQEPTAEPGTVTVGPTAGSPPVFNPAPLNSFDTTQATYYQYDESTGSSPTPNPIVAIPAAGRGVGRYGQLTTAGTRASVFNFGRGSGGSRQIAGNLCEPQPFTAVPNAQANAQATWLYFHTNMAWYTTFSVNGQISGLSKVGSTLLLCDSGSGNTLYKLPAAPTVGAGKVAALTVLKTPLGTGLDGKALNIGAVTAAPSAGGGAMVVNGQNGIAAFNQQLTLIADNNRILEVDADGRAVWSADATTRDTGSGVQTKVDFAHPSALSPFAANDYMVADTGNNRCVRFDRAGNVIWELTRFYDPSGLMAPGQPFTLSQPTSVEVRRELGPNYTDPVTGKTLTSQLVHYLVADSGNDRIVEVTDTLDSSGNILYFSNTTPATVVLPGAANSVTHDHLLTWVTHTGDKYGRRYHYTGASYLNLQSASANRLEVVALVTNTRVAQPTVGGALAPATGDAPGGSIVAFNVPLTSVPYNLITSITPNDLIYVATGFNTTTPTGGTQSYPIRNPRFLHVFTPPQPIPATLDQYVYSFLYADDNGAFDLVYSPTAPPTSYGLAFTQASYRSMTTAADTQGNVPLRNGPAANGISAIPFVPTCVQRLNNDATNVFGTNHIERYLITQSYSQGELSRLPSTTLPTPPTRLGGEIFEVDVSTSGTGASTIVNAVPVGGFAGAVTLSRPVGTSPLTQPTSAIRTAQ